MPAIKTHSTVVRHQTSFSFTRGHPPPHYSLVLFDRGQHYSLVFLLVTWLWRHKSHDQSHDQSHDRDVTGHVSSWPSRYSALVTSGGTEFWLVEGVPSSRPIRSGSTNTREHITLVYYSCTLLQCFDNLWLTSVNATRPASPTKT
jgi:hypothetical protein